MARISHDSSNEFDRPNGSFLRNGPYVYVNTSNSYVSPDMKKKNPGTRGYTGHESVCIGVLTTPSDPNCKRIFANGNYRKMFLKTELPDPPLKADSITVGFMNWIGEAAEQAGLVDLLSEVFGEIDASQVLDLAQYMMSRESAVMQHYPAWAREHAIFSQSILSDTELGKFLRSNITIPKINLFREKWMVSNLADGKVYLCYDSTNVNCQAKGVMIVQKGHAKDDATLPQVNTDYVVRQSDGLPLTYLHSPGSITDIAQAQEMIAFIRKAKEISSKEVQLCLICDRGYISEKNLRLMDDAGLDYILMLRTNFGLYDELAEKSIDTIKSYRYSIENPDEEEIYGVSWDCAIYEKGPTCKAQIFWSAERYSDNRKEVINRINKERTYLQNLVETSVNKPYIEKDLKQLLKKIPPYFILETEPAPPVKIEQKLRGRGNGTKVVEKKAVKISGFKESESGVNREIQKAGLMILITSEPLTPQETLDAYAKRDCVEKVFEALKSHLGMDKIGVTTEEAMHGKGFIWFVASILHSLLFTGTAPLRVTNRKVYTVPSMVDILEAIKADKDLTTGKYNRRYKLTKRQSLILGKWKIDETHIDNRIAQLE